LADEPCDSDHYCTFVDWDYYGGVQVAGIGLTIACVAISTIVVLLRDITKVWDCFGSIYDQPGKNPGRQLTTMSAAYAAETMPQTQMPQQGFQQVPVQMGQMPTPMQQMPMQQMPMQPQMMQQAPMMQQMPMQPMQPQMMQQMPMPMQQAPAPVYMGSA